VEIPSVEEDCRFAESLYLWSSDRSPLIDHDAAKKRCARVSSCTPVGLFNCGLLDDHEFLCRLMTLTLNDGQVVAAR